MEPKKPAYIGKLSAEEVMSLFSQHVSSGKVRFFQQAGIDFVMGCREGAFYWDNTRGKRVIDCHTNGGVFNLGHRNPLLVETLMRSLHELDIGNHHLISEQRALLAQKLAELTPGNLGYSVFGVGGGEAVDLAIKIARAYTRRPKIISARVGYHGHTGFALAAGSEKFRAPFGPMPPGFVHIPFGDIAAMEEAVDEDTAAVILETIPATAGILVPHAEYLPSVREICDRNGALLIIDEVQTGLGRTGRLWGVEHFGVVPDIMVIGKGLSGGLYPLTATCFREKYESIFHPDPFIHISTFGGAEIGCPVALKVLEISSDPAFLQHVREIAAFFAAGFEELKQRYTPLLTGLRQLGMMMGIELAHETSGMLFSRLAYENGLLCVYAYHDPRVVQFLPPLTIDQTLAKEILERVDQTMKALSATLGG